MLHRVTSWRPTLAVASDRAALVQAYATMNAECRKIGVKPSSG
jgi:hypothetical protein